MRSRFMVSMSSFGSFMDWWRENRSYSSASSP